MKKKSLLMLLSLCVLLCGCEYENTGSSEQENSDVSDNTSVTSTESSGEDTATSSTATPSQGAATNADTKISFDGSSVNITGENAKADGSVVTITGAGVYELSGSGDGQVVIEAGKDDKVTLILNGLDLTCSTSAPIYCINADTLTVELADGSQNILTDGENYTLESGEDEPDAALFSKDDTVITGGGSLAVTANYKDGIKCKDTLEITGGNITVNSVDDGITGKDSLVISGGSITVKSGGDGLKSTEADDAQLGYITLDGGTFNIDAEGDAVQAQTLLTVNGGEYTIVTGGGSAGVQHSDSGNFGGGRFDRFSADGNSPFDFDTMTDDSGSSTSNKAFKADTSITVNNGIFSIDSADDAFHSADVTVNAGEISISTGDDAFHADNKLTVSGGNIDIPSCYEGLEGMTIDITGGTVALTALDDGLNAAGGDNAGAWGFNPEGSDDYYINITDGDITVNASGDGIDSNGSVAMSGGRVIVYGPTNSGNGALDYQMSFDLKGGTLIALGAVGMAQTPSESSQPCYSLNSDVAANTEISVKDSSGNKVLSTVTPKNCQSIIISSPELKAGTEYTVYSGENAIDSFTAENGVTGSTAGGMGGPGGGMGGFGGHGDRPMW